MTHPTLSCGQFADSLADFLERDLAEPTRSAMEAHALSCDDCGPLLADLRRLRLDAANLPELAPSRDLWSGIASRIETEVVALPHRDHAAEPGRAHAPRRARLWMGLAAAGLVAVTAGVTYQLARRGVTTPVQTVAANSAPIATLSSPPRSANPAAPGAASPRADSVANVQRAAAQPAARLASNTARPSAELTYDREISHLRTIVNGRRGKLDTATVAVIDRNLRIIDDAIAQCRAALAKDPASQYLIESLNDALDNKVQLLRTAATLPVRM